MTLASIKNNTEINENANLYDFEGTVDTSELLLYDGSNDSLALSGITHIQHTETTLTVYFRIISEDSSDIDITLTGEINSKDIGNVNQIGTSSLLFDISVTEEEIINNKININLNIIDNNSGESFPQNQDIELFYFYNTDPNSDKLELDSELHGYIKVLPNVIEFIKDTQIIFNARDYTNQNIWEEIFLVGTDELLENNIDFSEIYTDEMNNTQLNYYYEYTHNNGEVFKYTLNSNLTIINNYVSISFNLPTETTIYKSTLKDFYTKGTFPDTMTEEILINSRLMLETEHGTFYAIIDADSKIWECYLPIHENTDTLDVNFTLTYKENRYTDSIEYTLSPNFLFLSKKIYTIKDNKIDLYFYSNLNNDTVTITSGSVNGSPLEDITLIQEIDYGTYYKLSIEIPLVSGFTDEMNEQNLKEKIINIEIEAEKDVKIINADISVLTSRNKILTEKEIKDTDWIEDYTGPFNDYPIKDDYRGNFPSQPTNAVREQKTALEYEELCSAHRSEKDEGILPYEMNKITAKENSIRIIPISNVNPVEKSIVLKPRIVYDDVLSLRTHLKHIASNFNLNKNIKKIGEISGVDEGVDFRGTIFSKDWLSMAKYANILYKRLEDYEEILDVDETNYSKGKLIYSYVYNDLIDLYNLIYRSCVCDSDCLCNAVCICNTNCGCNY